MVRVILGHLLQSERSFAASCTLCYQVRSPAPVRSLWVLKAAPPLPTTCILDRTLDDPEASRLQEGPGWRHFCRRTGCGALASIASLYHLADIGDISCGKRHSAQFMANPSGRTTGQAPGFLNWAFCSRDVYVFQKQLLVRY